MRSYTQTKDLMKPMPMATSIEFEASDMIGERTMTTTKGRRNLLRKKLRDRKKDEQEK